MKQVTLTFLFLISLISNAQCWQFISAGDYHNLAIKSDGTLWAWGLNSSGQLGDGTTANRNVPTQVGTDTNWATAAAGDNFSYAIKQDGTMYAWGGNNRGQLGNNTTIGRTTVEQVGTASDWAKVACGQFYVIAQKTNNSFWGCGYNTFSQLGVGTTTTSFSVFQPIPITGTFLTFKVASRHTVLLKDDFTYWCWGNGGGGRLGTGNDGGGLIPVQITSISDLEQVTPLFSATMFKKTNGTIWGVGENSAGYLGLGHNISANYAIQQIGTDTDWRSIEQSNYCSFIIKNNGTLWSCGFNFSGQQGNGTTTHSNILAQVGIATNWGKVHGGLFHTIALTNTGTLMAWGDNSVGQLGDGTFVNSLVPKQIGEICTLNNQSFTSENVKLYPNPFNETFSISIPNYFSEAITVKVFDVLGKLVEEKTISIAEIYNLKLGANYTSGVYQVIVAQGANYYMQRVIKN